MRILMIIAALALSGCASLQNAGTAEYTIKPFVIDKQTVCCEVVVKNGKEYASLKAHIAKTGDNYVVDLEEQSVSAFKGQEISAGATNKAVDAAATLGAAILTAPAAGAALGTGLKVLAQ